MGASDPVKRGPVPSPPFSAAGDRRLSRGRPRDFTEWQVLRRWGKLPAWERDVPGYLLRDARTAAGLTQDEMARRMGVTQQAIAQAERWAANPTVGLMLGWAEACNATLEILFIPARTTAKAHPVRR